jgi:hypothetical protein
MSQRATKGRAKEAAYVSAETRVRASVVAKQYGVCTNSIYHAARRCGLKLPQVKNSAKR